MNILVIKLAALGDVCMATPLVDNLRRGFPDSRVDWLTVPWSAPLLENHPGIEQVLGYEPPWQTQSNVIAYSRLLPLLFALRRKRYDLALVAHRSGLAGMLAKAAGIKRIIAFEGVKYATDTVPYDMGAHEVDRNLALLAPLGIESLDKQMRIYLSSDEKRQAENFFHSKGLDGRKIAGIGLGGGVNPGLSMVAKRWPLDKYIALGRWLHQREFTTLLIGGNSDEELSKAYLEAIPAAISAVGEASLRETAALLERCDIYVGNDSGPLFMAASVGTSTVGLYGPSDPRLVAPRGKRNTYVWNQVECAPCYRPDTVHEQDFSKIACDLTCMEGLRVEEVQVALEGMLENE